MRDTSFVLRVKISRNFCIKKLFLRLIEKSTMKIFFIFILLPIFCFSQKENFFILNDIKDLENTYYSKSILDNSSKSNDVNQAHLLRLFNIKEDVSEANQVKISFLTVDTLQLLYGNNQTKNFKYKRYKKYIEVSFENENINIPFIYQNTNIDKLRLGLNKDHNILVKKIVEKGGAIFILGDSYGFTSDYIFTEYNKYDDLKPFSKNEKWGIILKKDTIIKPQYDAATIFESKYILVKSNKKWGLLNQKGEAIIPINYDNILKIDNTSNKIFYVMNDGKVGLVNSEGKEIVSPIYDRISRFNDDYFELELNQKYGLATTEKIIYPALYTYLGGFSRGRIWERYLDNENKYITAKRDGKDVILDSLGFEYQPNIRIPTFDYGQKIFPIKETAKKVSNE